MKKEKKKNRIKKMLTKYNNGIWWPSTEYALVQIDKFNIAVVIQITSNKQIFVHLIKINEIVCKVKHSFATNCAMFDVNEFVLKSQVSWKQSAITFVTTKDARNVYTIVHLYCSDTMYIIYIHIKH